METVKEEHPPYFCWRCGDKIGIGGFHEIPSNAMDSPLGPGANAMHISEKK